MITSAVVSCLHSSLPVHSASLTNHSTTCESLLVWASNDTHSLSHSTGRPRQLCWWVGMSKGEGPVRPHPSKSGPRECTIFMDSLVTSQKVSCPVLKHSCLKLHIGVVLNPALCTEVPTEPHPQAYGLPHADHPKIEELKAVSGCGLGTTCC